MLQIAHYRKKIPRDIKHHTLYVCFSARKGTVKTRFNGVVDVIEDFT